MTPEDEYDPEYESARYRIIGAWGADLRARLALMEATPVKGTHPGPLDRAVLMATVTPAPTSTAPRYSDPEDRRRKPGRQIQGDHKLTRRERNARYAAKRKARKAPEGQIRLGARDVIAEEAFEERT